ncbi:zeta toxin family protein [Flavobacterium johnsoniae]|jgi:predicted ABC-type ATPase|uniref:Predicted ABC-type ATPase n=1 Tax=Flavobacterium johnsoniae TaxID=986 RepID=A0A1M5HAJ1_FLAJO|nr:zeta toxin family protein [Flavobacterium johnsoniae]SHG12961.1 Predicted ABC-type ATPase [Flavobacterium johnsoniae]
MSKNLYIISGCNGAGKTTASFTILPEVLDCREFVNADEIAKGLSPFQPEKVAFEAGRIMLHRISELLESGQVFAFETTLATKSYKSKIALAQEKGYKVILLFFWLQDVELAIERVKTRVLEGGHNIEKDVIRRRYINGIANLFNIYLPIVDEVMIFDNSFGKPELIAEKMLDTEIDVINEIKYDKLKNIYNENI